MRWQYQDLKILLNCKKENSTHVDYQAFMKSIRKLKRIDWSAEGPFKYLKGISGSKTLAIGLYDVMSH
ncbi:hypothetical protein [Paenibacillus polymyxa]|uniref:hypothetical protein n=1 Tax=Paenibacillus polymyxa TaxID=1406 RepID=UPI0025B697F2|nr:hypothetical protein [Paenibacillus polymyxa]